MPPTCQTLFLRAGGTVVNTRNKVPAPIQVYILMEEMVSQQVKKEIYKVLSGNTKCNEKKIEQGHGS